ncbi:hypothetical protein BJY24_002418 [Nocardia transvalensis]|uniref:O-acyltransferase WSD1 C-terminal domain-containing protein n=1 Tax=Nocardia transvalensis TaxID=37333 RepID=A0A7W9PCT4_9NOCA|nr:WS/DGAT domain-containing protein [Nocardia transvalensis]MBB5913551.1 hypothetical protein [Nocardia transvalensis]
MDALTPQDATRYWLSHRTRNDLFLLYCFTDAGRSLADLRAVVAERSARIPDLTVRVRERRFAYPVWVWGSAGDRVVDHTVSGSTWEEVVAALGGLLGGGVRADECPWRVHLFRGVTGAPGGEDPALVVVLQVSHALADGQRAAGIARALFSESDSSWPVDNGRGAGAPRRLAGLYSGSADRGESCGGWVFPGAERVAGLVVQARVVGEELFSIMSFPVRLVRTVVRGLAAARARRALAELTERSAVPPPAASLPATMLNRSPEPTSHIVRMLVRDDLRVPGYTVTVVALTAIGAALDRYLAQRGEPAELSAQVSMAVPARNKHSRNNYRDLAVELHGAERDPRRRAERIAADLESRRVRSGHPLTAVGGRVTDVLPAPVLRRDIATYPIDQVPDTLTGHTVVSSVNRGPADLTFGSAPVRFTAGFPALGTVMHLTHGIHGLGSTITVSIHADPEVIPDIDVYAALLNTTLTETVDALSRVPADE